MNHIQSLIRQKLPMQQVVIKPMRDSEALAVARWIGQARNDHVFKPGPRVTRKSLLDYQRSLCRAGWRYECMIISVGKRAVGYVDYRWRKAAGEILGIFVETPYRGKRIGSYVMRWVLAHLRLQDCLRVRVEVHADNSRSLNMCKQVGFQRRRGIVCKEGKKVVLELVQRLTNHEYVSPVPEAFGNLRGENLVPHHYAVASLIVEEIQKIPGVELILGLGSLWRGFGDRWSDIDIAVIGRGESLKSLWRGEFWASGFSIDLYVVDMDYSPPSQWDNSRRQAFGESVVLFTRTGSLAPLRSAVRLRREERRVQIMEVLFRLGWIGFEPESWYETWKYGYYWSLPPDLWEKRGFPPSASGTLGYAFDLALKLLFLANGVRIPDPKWRIFLAPHLSWCPDSLGPAIDATECRQTSTRAREVRIQRIRHLVEDVVRFLERSRDISGNMYRDYLLSSSDYNPRA